MILRLDREREVSMGLYVLMLFEGGRGRYLEPSVLDAPGGLGARLGL